MKTHEPFPKHALVNKAVNPDRIDPFVDWGFKYIFGREDHKDLLLAFLDHLLQPEVRIRDIRYLNTALVPDAPDIKHCIVDVLATDEEENRYLIEMQNVYDPDIRKRLVYYACRLVDQMSRHNRDWHYGQIKKVYAICLMNFNYERSPVLRRDFQLRDAEGARTFSDLLTIIPLQIPCIRATSPSEYRKSYEFWLYLLESLSDGMKTKDQLLAEVDGFQHISKETKDLFRKVINTVEADLPAEQRRDYELALIQYQDTIEEYRTALDKGIAQGRKEGREEGLKEGRKEGRKEGFMEGRGKAFVEAAKAMKAEGVDPTVISKCTGLSIDEISKL